MKRLLLIVVASLAVAVGFAGAARADGIVDTITVTVEPATRSISLGETFPLRVTVTNNGVRPSPPLVIHLDVTDPGKSTSVDPEDWTSTLSKSVGIVAASDAATVDWNVQPVSAGTFAAYAVALSPGVDNVATSNVLEVTVADRRSLNPRGILLVAVSTPALVGALLLLQLRRGRRTRGRESPSATA